MIFLLIWRNTNWRNVEFAYTISTIQSTRKLCIMHTLPFYSFSRNSIWIIFQYIFSIILNQTFLDILFPSTYIQINKKTLNHTYPNWPVDSVGMLLWQIIFFIVIKRLSSVAQYFSRLCDSKFLSNLIRPLSPFLFWCITMKYCLNTQCTLESWVELSSSLLIRNLKDCLLARKNISNQSKILTP